MQKQLPAIYTALLLVVLSSSVGCVSLAANMIGAFKGNNFPVAYKDLEGQSVAIVCSCDTDSSVPRSLTNFIEANLNSNIDDIEVIRQAEVERWLDSHGRTEEDYYAIGKGVEADKLLAVEVHNFSLNNGATLYRGEADVMVTVYDIPSGGKKVFSREMLEFAYPEIGGRSVTDTSLAKFRGQYLTILAKKVSGLFYPVDVTEGFAIDATSNSF